MFNDHYLRLDIHENNYNIYLVKGNKKKKITNTKHLLLMYKIIKNYHYNKISQYTYIYPDIKEIMREFRQTLETQKKQKKVNRKKAMAIVGSTIIIGTSLFTSLFGNSSKKAPNITDNNSNTIDESEEEINEYDKFFEDSNLEIQDHPIINPPENEIEEELELTPNTPIYEAKEDTTNEIDTQPTITSLNTQISEAVITETNTTNLAEKVEKPTYTEPEIKYTEENNEQYNDIPCFYYEYDNIGDKEALYNASQYMDTFKKYEQMYGVDANILCAIAAQESSGIHKDYSVNGYALGLMAIEYIWEGKTIEVFNFETNSYETINIDYNKVAELDYNVRVGAAIVQNEFYYVLNNYKNLEHSEKLAFAIQEYNMGIPNMQKILSISADWINNREVVNAGDKNYFEHVLTRLDNDTVVNMRLPNGEYYTTSFNNTYLTKNNTLN